MHQMSNNRYNLKLTSHTDCLRTWDVKTHRKNTAFLSICFFLIQPFVVINNKDLLKTRLIFNFYAHISCKKDWNKFLLLNTNGPLSFYTLVKDRSNYRNTHGSWQAASSDTGSLTQTFFFLYMVILKELLPFTKKFL